MIMMYKAIESFSGLITMAAGEMREIEDAYIAADLLKAGYIEEVKEAKDERNSKGKRSSSK